MKYLISRFLSVNLILIATCAATANAATVTIPATAAPAPTSGQPSPKGTAPLVPGVPSGGSKITYAGPTANITEVANHIQIQAKSLTSLIQNLNFRPVVDLLLANRNRPISEIGSLDLA